VGDFLYVGLIGAAEADEKFYKYLQILYNFCNAFLNHTIKKKIVIDY